MAFTETQKVKIRYYLGWGSRFAQADSALESAIAAIEGDETEAQTHVSTLITDLDVIYNNLKSCHNGSRIKADVAGSIKINRLEIRQLRDEGKRLAQSLASFMNVTPRHNVFSSGRYRYGPEFGGALPPGYMPHG